MLYCDDMTVMTLYKDLFTAIIKFEIYSPSCTTLLLCNLYMYLLIK